MIGFPFDSHVTYDGDGNPLYDRAISSEPYRKLLNQLFTTGVMPNPSTNLQVIAGDGMKVIVKAGFAMVNGCMKLEETDRELTLQASNSNYDRIDTVVMRLNTNDNARYCDLYVVAGTPAQTPTSPALTRSGSIYEIGLADVFVAKNTITIQDYRITDTRYNTSRCGVVSSISEFDTTTLNNQMNAWAEEQREEFSEWVESIKDILDEATAGNLQNEIEALNNTIASLPASSVVVATNKRLPAKLTEIETAIAGKQDTLTVNMYHSTDDVGIVYLVKQGYLVNSNFQLDFTLFNSNTWENIGYIPNGFAPAVQIVHYLADGTQIVFNTDRSIVAYGVAGRKYGTAHIGWHVSA